MSYNTAEGVASHLNSTEGFADLRKKRHVAGYERRERLAEFVVLGRWCLDSCGNTMLITENSPFSLGLTFDPVMSLERMREIVGDKHWTSVSGPPTPPAKEKCIVCGQGWAISNAHDFVASRGGDEVPVFSHSVCSRSYAANRERAEFVDIIANAGYPYAIMHAIPNGYWLREPSAAPWFLVQVGLVTLRIGWRKRVISIDWESTRVKLPGLFSEFKTTQDDHCVHAWSAEQAIQFLRMLVPALAQRMADK